MAKVEAEVGKRSEGMWGGLVKWIDDRFPMTETLEYHVTKYYAAKSFNWWYVFGVLAFVVLWAYNMSFQTFLREDKAFITFITSRPFMLFALLLGAAHLLFMGYEGWLNPGGWHGGLPPISLVAFTIFVVGYIINLLGRE